MASSLEDSCQAWNCKIVPLEEGGEEEKNEEDGDDNSDEDDLDSSVSPNGREAIGLLGVIEHLRHLLPPQLKQTLKANRLYWMTDRTPHESLPLKAAGPRQFFRLVTSQVSLWYEDHSTLNPEGVKPNTKITKIVKGNKFSKDGVEIVG